MSKTVIDFDVIDSTNDHLKVHYKGYLDHTFIRARYQYQGRGQFDRVWVSEKDQNLLFSLLLKDVEIEAIDPIRDQVKEILLAFLHDYGINASFKAPNDITVGDKKIAGVLIETKGSGKRLDAFIIGIGLNVNQCRFDMIEATSMAIEGKNIPHLDTLFDDLSTRFDVHI
jgi:BirA family transcriptional regulator, biotin operon repressor / biotin---[acetyl-CoA-carboxylase] ligase